MRILFVKTSSLGDVIHNCPAVSDVRRHFPGASIDWVVEEQFAPVAALHSAVARVVPVAVRRWRSRLLQPAAWREFLAFRRDLRAETYDLVIDTQGLLKSAVISRGARGVRHGYDAESARESLASRFYDVRHAVRRDLHAVERNRKLSAMAAGFAPGGECDYALVAPRGVPVMPSELPTDRFLPDKSYCVLLSMTSRTDKLWPEEYWADLVQLLSARGMQCLLPWGSAAEHARCLRIAAHGGGGIVPRALSLAELASVLARAQAVFGVDTGLAHLAAALGVRAIGLYRSTDPALTGLLAGDNAVNLGGPGRMPLPAEAVAAMERMG